MLISLGGKEPAADKATIKRPAGIHVTRDELDYVEVSIGISIADFLPRRSGLIHIV